LVPWRRLGERSGQRREALHYRRLTTEGGHHGVLARVVAAVLSQPSGHRPEDPDIFWNNKTTNWGPALCAKRPEITMPMVERFLHKMYRSPADFVFTVPRDFVRSCRTPMLVLPDDIPAHP
jgi:hypothetical protein